MHDSRSTLLAAVVLALAPLACALPEPRPYHIPPASNSPSYQGEAGGRSAPARLNSPPCRGRAGRRSATSEAPFWWGISTSAFQIEEPGEDHPVITDWDLSHRRGTIKDPRTDKVAGFSRFERDIAALKWLGVTHYRFSVCWARVEPAPGRFDEEALAHYARLARRLGEEGITPVVCLWHFTFPAWLSNLDDPNRHGWLHPDAAAAWPRFVRRVVETLAPHVDLFAPQNEPNAYALAVSIGLFPPMRYTSVGFFDRLIAVEVERFREAAAIIRESRPDARILSVQNIGHWRQDFFDPLRLWYRKALDYNYCHLDGIIDVVDLVGFNYYQAEVASLAVRDLQLLRSGPHVSDLGWIIDPEGLEREIVALARRYHKPLVITENGIADATDEKRPLYLFRHLAAIRRARRAGYDVRGYFHWTLMDNYEWGHGYDAPFGLFTVAPNGDMLVPKRSAHLYRRLVHERFMQLSDVSTP